MTELKKNDIYRSVVTGYTSEGEGVCRIEGRAVFVKGVLEGEECDVRILKATKTAVYGKLEKLVTPSENRIDAVCPIYSKCGGCSLMHMTYEEELKFKKNKVDSAIRRIGGIELETERINGALDISNYRNKAIFAIGGAKGNAVHGFFRRHTHEISAVDECCIQADYSDRAAKAVTMWMNKYGVVPYDEKKTSGSIRHVFARYAFGTKQGQVTVVTAEKLKNTDSMIHEILKICPETKSIVININRTKGNTVLAGDFYTIWGTDYIEEELCSLKFRLSPRSFFQVNRDQAQRLYDKAIEYAALNGSETVVDLYCGTGTITLCLARKAGKAIGAEIVDAAVKDAKENAVRNGIENAEFICADSSDASKYLRDSGIKPDVIVVDPPRKGLAADVVKTIADMKPDRVVYVSCEPSTLARDLAVFAACGYKTEKAEAFDLFPRTYHVETVILLSRKDVYERIKFDVNVEELNRISQSK